MFHINGEEWRVVYVAPSHPKLIRSDGSVSIGACDDDTKPSTSVMKHLAAN